MATTRKPAKKRSTKKPVAKKKPVRRRAARNGNFTIPSNAYGRNIKDYISRTGRLDSATVPLVLRNNATTQSILRKIKAFGEFYGATVKAMRGGGVRVTLIVENDRSGEFERWSDVGRGRTSAEAIDDALEGILSQL